MGWGAKDFFTHSPIPDATKIGKMQSFRLGAIIFSTAMFSPIKELIFDLQGYRNVGTIFKTHK